MGVFAPENDKALREGIRGFYSQLLSELPIREPVIIRLPINDWISANALNMLLTFIEALFLRDQDVRVFVEIIDNEYVQESLTKQGIDSEFSKNLTNKLIFYEAMELIKLLRERHVVVIPSKEKLAEIKNKLGAYKKSRVHLYSSRMLCLSPLIESEQEHYGLTTRVKTLTKILRTNLYNRHGKDDVEKASELIMYEQVKNIYQHGGLPDSYISRARGFACAQINQIPIITSKKYSQWIVESALKQVKKPIQGKKWKWLSITVNDFGIGLSNKISSFIKKKIVPGDTVKFGNYCLSTKNADDHEMLIKVAVMTSFTTHMHYSANDTMWNAGDYSCMLAERGKGLVYCMGFIAGKCGRMRLRSGNVEVDFFANPDNLLAPNIWEDPNKVVEYLEHGSAFDIVPNPLHVEQSRFPGTQLLIEIPVEVW